LEEGRGRKSFSEIIGKGTLEGIKANEEDLSADND
jgi:hypothetical protein